MTPIIIETELTPKDWAELRIYLSQRILTSHHLLRGYLQRVLLFAGGALLVAVLLRLLGVHPDPGTLIATLLVCLLSVLVVQRYQVRRWKPDKDGVLLGPARIEIDATGVRNIRPGQSSFTDWSRVREIEETVDYLYLPTDRIAALFIPKRSLPAESIPEIVEQLRRWRAERMQAQHEPAQTASADDTPPAGPVFVYSSPAHAAAPPRRRFLQSLRDNLRAGFKVFALRRVSAADFTATFDQVVALLVADLLVAVVFNWLWSDPDAEFGLYGLYAWAYYLLSGFWVCALVARLQSAQTNTRALLTAWLAAFPFVFAALWLIYHLPFVATYPTLAAIAGITLIAFASFRGVRAVFGYSHRATFPVLVLAVLGLPWFLNYLGIEPTLWAPAESEQAESNEDQEDAESILFDEPERVAEAVEKTAPERPGVTDTYFLGFAGHGDQRVFRREALFGERMFNRVFGSGERSVELINDVTDRDTYPLATVSGLRYALQLIGERMDRDNDLLVLLITSHGSSEGTVSVTNGGLPLNDLEPGDLRDALDQSGITWRVVIVSACYAGAFLDPLKSDNTLVITASDAEHSSFGCADDRDLTYFGEAFLRDALPGAPSLEAAFLKARALIEERENAEKLTHSNPQLYAGAAIRAKLATSVRPAKPPAAPSSSALTVSR